MGDKTTIQLKKEVLELMKKAKQYRRETHEDQIKRMLKEEIKLKGGKYGKS